ncbi:MAG: CHASE domain-containing protein, partial [Betaproteobacteria bacterium]|nr:CHASE domain-containing protein [Betaproteobacteria bacterium]
MIVRNLRRIVRAIRNRIALDLHAAGVLAGALAVTGAIWAVTWRAEEQAAEERFDAIVSTSTRAVYRRMTAYEQVLRGASASLALDPTVTREQWKTYVDSLKLSNAYPGIQGVGWAVFLRPGDLDAHIRRMRSEGFPDFTVRPAGRRGEYASIVFLEPFDERNQRAFGYDMLSEPVRREALHRARDTGQPALSGKVRLVQESQTKIQAGTLFYVPVYRSAQRVALTAERRQELLVGWAYAAFRMDDLMRAILDGNPEIEMRIYDGDRSGSAEALLYDDALSIHNLGPRELSPSPRFRREIRQIIAGRTWTLQFESAPPFETAHRGDKALMVLLAGVPLSALLAALILAMSGARRRAEALVAERSRALAATEERLGKVIEELEWGKRATEEAAGLLDAVVRSAVDAIIVIDEKGIVESFNPAAERLFGYTAKEV